MPKRIFVFGDSIVWGASDKKYGGWVDHFKIWFGNEFGKYNQVYNLGIPGKTLLDLSARIVTEIKDRKTVKEYLESKNILK